MKKDKLKNTSTKFCIDLFVCLNKMYTSRKVQLIFKKTNELYV